MKSARAPRDFPAARVYRDDTAPSRRALASTVCGDWPVAAQIIYLLARRLCHETLPRRRRMLKRAIYDSARRSRETAEACRDGILEDGRGRKRGTASTRDHAVFGRGDKSTSAMGDKRAPRRARDIMTRDTEAR